jgi:hypothetical protein
MYIYIKNCEIMLNYIQLFWFFGFRYLIQIFYMKKKYNKNILEYAKAFQIFLH